MIRYMKVEWQHDLPNEPVLLLSEIVNGRETRKIEVYRDGRCDFADENSNSGTTILSETLMPSVEEIASDPQFSPKEITNSQFEEFWRRTRLSEAD
jgi:hypothetical protein